MTMLETMGIIMISLSEAKVFNRKQAREYFKKYHPEHLDNLNWAFKRGWVKRNRFYGYDLSQTGFREYQELSGQQRYTIYTDSDGKKTVIPQPLRKRSGDKTN